MAEALGFMLPAAFAAILLSLPAILVVILLLEPGRDATTPRVFALGFLLSFVVVGGVFLLAADAITPDDYDDRSTWVSVLLLVIGLALFGLAGKKFVGRPKPGDPPKETAISKAVASLTPIKAFPMGFVLGGLNPKFLAVIASLAAELILTGASLGGQMLVMVVFAVIGSLGVIGPLMAIRIAGDGATAALGKVSDLLNQWTWLIMALILAYFGVKLVGDALRALT
jgi:threonine/homoserine/homoserine lactone efflux protein